MRQEKEGEGDKGKEGGRSRSGERKIRTKVRKDMEMEKGGHGIKDIEREKGGHWEKEPEVGIGTERDRKRWKREKIKRGRRIVDE